MSNLRYRHMTPPPQTSTPRPAPTVKPASQGSRITIIGLFANVGLTVTKGIAGWALASPALLADAAHSGSDLIADVVTLGSFKMSRRERGGWYPWGFGKYESLGSVLVTFLLIATAFGLGFHSYHQLLETLSHTTYFSASLLAKLDLFPKGHSHDHSGHDHGHDHSEPEGGTDARAMLFAAASVLVKEWLYQMTIKIAKAEHSNVLMANALHHRSDAFGSLVALGAIGGSYLGFPVLDPLGGLFVAGMIGKNGVEVGWEAFRQLVDEVTDPSLVPEVHEIILSLRDPTLPSLSPLKSLSPTASHSHSHSHSHHSHSHSHSPPPSPTKSKPSSTPSLRILDIPSILVHSSGPSLIIFIKLVLENSLTVGQSDEIVSEVREAVREGLGEDRVEEVWVAVEGK